MRRIGVGLALVLVAFAALPALASAKGGGSGSHTAAEGALQRVEDLKHGIGVRTGRELTPAIAELFRTRGALDPTGRKQAAALLARPTQGASDPQNDGYTVTEETPVCTTHFCIHYVDTTADAPPLTDTTPSNGVPDFVEQMASVFETEVFPCENGTAPLGCANAASNGLGWPAAPSDGSLGGDARFDVYLKQLGDQGIFGYVAPDPQPNGSSLFSYLVMDNNFSQAEFGYADPLVPMRVTAAHEYNHVLQFGIEAFEDTWMFESTATWAEEKVYPAIDDYLGYVDEWVKLTNQPLTAAPGDSNGTSVREDLKIYGSAVWNHFIDGRHGEDSILDAWTASVDVNGGPFAPASYGAAIAANGGTGFSEEFDDFSAAVAEWRAPSSGFPDLYPDLPAAARPNLSGTSLSIDHTTAKYRNIPVPASSSTLTLVATLPAGLKGAVALVARTGNSTTAGTVTTVIQRLSNGGQASVSLPAANTYGRITAVFVNSDPTQNGFNNGKQDWNFTKDNQTFSGIQATTAVAAPPSATTAPATLIGSGGATLNGSVNPNGRATTYTFEYGTTTAYGSQIPLTPASAGSGSAGQAVSAQLTGLDQGTTYHYRMVAQNVDGTTAGGDQTFTTLDPPIVSTDGASGVTASGATLNATIDPRSQATTYVFEYGTTTAYGNQIPLTPASAGGGSSPVAVGVALTGLSPATTIHYRVVATNADGTTAGGDQSFTTLTPAGTTTPPGTGTTTAPTPTTSTTPGTTPETSSTTTTAVPLAVRLSLLRAKLRTALRKGLRARSACSRACSLVVKAQLSARLAKKLRLPRTVAIARKRAGTSVVTVVLRFRAKARRALARRRSLRLTIVLTGTSADGGRRSVRKPATLRR